MRGPSCETLATNVKPQGRRFEAGGCPRTKTHHKTMDLHVPFTGPSPKDREREALRAELARANQALSDLRIAWDIAQHKADEFKQARDRYRQGYESAAKRVAELTR